jgi:hypothetical protein
MNPAFGHAHEIASPVPSVSVLEHVSQDLRFGFGVHVAFEAGLGIVFPADASERFSRLGRAKLKSRLLQFNPMLICSSKADPRNAFGRRGHLSASVGQERTSGACTNALKLMFCSSVLKTPFTLESRIA